MSIVSVDDLVSRPITVMNTIQEAVHVETRLEYSHFLRYVRTSISLFLHEASKLTTKKTLRLHTSQVIYSKAIFRKTRFIYFSFILP